MSFFSPDSPVTYRPLSLSIIGWYYAVSGALGLLAFWVPLVVPSMQEMWRDAGVELAIFVAVGALTNTVQLASGIAILKRRSWGRILLLASIPATVLVLAFLKPPMMGFAAAGSVVSFGILAFFLTRPAASGYFDGTVTSMPDDVRRIRRLQRGERTQSGIARGVGVVLAFPGWWILTVATAALVGIVFVSVQAGGSFPPFRGPVSCIVWAAEGIGAALLASGTFLWGRRRWKGYLGWGMLVIGTNATVIALLGLFPFDPTQFLPPDQLDNLDPERFAAILRTASHVAAVVGATLLSLGGLLVHAQRRHDHAAAAYMDAEAPTSN